MVLGALWEAAEPTSLGGSVDTRLLPHRGDVPVRPARAPPELRLVDADGSAGAQQWTLGYNYNITKQTKVYAFYTMVDNDNNGNFVLGWLDEHGVGVTGASYSSIAVGVRHNF